MCRTLDDGSTQLCLDVLVVVEELVNTVPYPFLFDVICNGHVVSVEWKMTREETQR